MGRIPTWLAEMVQRQLTSITERDARVWGPGDGDVVFRGGEDADLLWLDGITLQQLRDGLRLDDPGIRLLVEGNGTVSFLGPDGRAARADGRVTIGRETLRFTGVARFAFLW
jgi:hypothetical protein